MISLYFLIFLILFILAIVELAIKRTNRFLLYFSYILLTVFLCLRCNPVPDYFEYYTIYLDAPVITSFSIKSFVSYIYLAITKPAVHGGWLWQCIQGFAKFFNIKYQVLMIIISLVMMALMIRFIEKHCKYKQFALFLLYPTYYIIYFFSAIRTGLCIAIFAGLLIDLLNNKKYILYLIIVMLMYGIHKSSIVYIFLLPVNLSIIEKHILDPKFQLITLIPSFLFGYLISKGLIISNLSSILPISVLYYFRPGTLPSFFGIGEKVFMYVICYFIVFKNQSNLNKKLFFIEYVGFVIYGLTIFTPFTANRLSILFKIVELAIVASHKFDKKVIINIALMAILILENSAIYAWSINHIINTYEMDCSILTYPYNSLIQEHGGQDYLNNCLDILYGRK